jgi:hypothetical protein
MSYRVQVSIPSPYKCKKCHRLGHTSSRCTLSSVNCGKCGKTQHPDHPCATFCINCGSKSHGSDSYSCPAYTEMKQIIKMAFLEGITVEEARERFSAVQNSVARRGNLRFSPFSLTPQQPLKLLVQASLYPTTPK